MQRFNPPPNWPRPPEGFRPPPDWQPDPAWGPPPPDWPLWVSARANPRAWAHALLSSAALFVLFVVLGGVLSGGRFGAEAVGEILGRQILAGALVGLIAWPARSRWPVWVYPLAVFGVKFVLVAVTQAWQAAHAG